jgi:hypothetical protein
MRHYFLGVEDLTSKRVLSRKPDKIKLLSVEGVNEAVDYSDLKSWYEPIRGGFSKLLKLTSIPNLRGKAKRGC